MLGMTLAGVCGGSIRPMETWGASGGVYHFSLLHCIIHRIEWANDSSRELVNTDNSSS